MQIANKRKEKTKKTLPYLELRREEMLRILFRNVSQYCQIEEISWRQKRNSPTSTVRSSLLGIGYVHCLRVAA